MSFLFIIAPVPSLACPLYCPKFHLSFPKKSARCCRFKSLIKRLWLYCPKQTFHWLISVSRDFRSPTVSFPIHLLLIIHLDKGSLVPPCAHMAGPRSPGLSHYLQKVIGYLIPCPRFSFLVPDPRSSFPFLVPIPRSGCNL